MSLDHAYRFLRRVEHRLQIEGEQQTHTLPDAPESLLRLARSLGFPSSEHLSRVTRTDGGCPRDFPENSLISNVLPGNTQECDFSRSSESEEVI